VSVADEAGQALSPAFSDAYATVYQGDCESVLPQLPAESADSIVTDSPYGLTMIDEAKTRAALDQWLSGNDSFVPDGAGFMSNEWDRFVPPPATWRAAARVLKPGGYVLCFAGSRTVDLMMLSLRLAGLHIAGTTEWVYGTGMPKASDVSRTIDRHLGHEGEVVGSRLVDTSIRNQNLHSGSRTAMMVTQDVRSLSALAQPWEGWYPNLKPAHEPVIIAQKPREDGSVDSRKVPPFRYIAKASTSERPAYFDEEGNEVSHNTVKPVAVMKWLVSLVTPVGGTVLDPFVGSGTTCEAATLVGVDSIGIELDAKHIPLVVARMTSKDLWGGSLFDWNMQ